ncbi:MAG: DUF6444 domain-containing protein [Methylococcales bacterium]
MPEKDLPSNCTESPDAEIERLRAQIVQQAAVIDELRQRIEELAARRAKDSHNSSKPPASDGLNRPKPKSLRRKGLNSTGGQKGHSGHTLKQVAHPDRIEQHLPPNQCDACHRPLPEPVAVAARQVFDIPPLRHEVTELPESSKYGARAASCIVASFQRKLRHRESHGPRIKAAVVQLTCPTICCRWLAPGN